MSPVLISGDCHGHHWPFHVAGRLLCGCRAHYGQPFRPVPVSTKGATR